MLKPLDPQLAKAAHICSDRDQATLYFGYWRNHEDPSHPNAAGPYGRMVESAQEDVDKSDRGEYVSLYVSEGDMARAGVKTKGEYLRVVLERDKMIAAAQRLLPWPGDFVDPDMPASERERVACILDSAPDVGGFCGVSWDRLDPNRATNGSRERSAAGYRWPSGLSRYVRKYGLVIDPAIIDAIALAQ